MSGNLARLDALLPPDPQADKPKPKASNGTPRPALALLPERLPAHLQRMLAEQAGADRSAQTHALVAAALEMGLDDGQVAVLLNSHAPTVEKYGNRIDDELARQLDKQRPKHPHPGQPCDRAGCPNRPRWQTGERNLTDWIGPRATATPAAGGQEPEQVGTSPQLPVDLAGFWAERPVLEHLHTYARARMVSPWALLGVSVVRALAVVPPHVVLPPIVGTHASLNFFVGLVGRSGAGKGAAEGAGHDALDVGPVEVFTAGSGEGLAHLYAHREKKELVRDRDAVLLTVPEVDTLVALKSRQGSTLLPALRSAWSGERLGFSYADRDKALPIDKHSYRLGLLLGIQPGRAAPLLEDADGGTPQRFLWLPATDPTAPKLPPVAPATRTVQRQRWGFHGLHVLEVPEVARETLVEANWKRLTEQTEALDGHALLTRLKLAQALALLDDRARTDDDDWRLSGVVMAVSDRTREDVRQHLAQQARETNFARARFDGERAAVAEDVATEHAVKRCARTLLRYVNSHQDVTRGDARRAMTSRDRRHFDEALAALVAAGQLEVVDTAHGERLQGVAK